MAFPKSRRVLSRSDYRRVYDQGQRLNSASFGLFLRRRDDEAEPRAGFTVPKALGKAVVRNRIRRRMREAVRVELGLLTDPVDLVFHPRRQVLDVNFVSLRKEVERALLKCRT